MDCQFAYKTERIEYILCKKETVPSPGDRKAIFHAICGHSAFCPQKNCMKMSPGWKSCRNLLTNATEQPVEPVSHETKATTAKKKKPSRKPVESAEEKTAETSAAEE